MSERPKHEWYGPCDGFGPGGACSECTGLIQHEDGSISDRSGKLVKKAPLRTRLQRAWWALHGVKRELDGLF